jgi:hypothetical protein
MSKDEEIQTLKRLLKAVLVADTAYWTKTKKVSRSFVADELDEIDAEWELLFMPSVVGEWEFSVKRIRP